MFQQLKITHEMVVVDDGTNHKPRPIMDSSAYVHFHDMKKKNQKSSTIITFILEFTKILIMTSKTTR